MTPDTKICELFLTIANRFADKFGAPLPNRLLELGDAENGWQVKLNPTNDKLDDVPPFTAVLHWKGFPAGFIDPDGGWLPAGKLANEVTFRAWLGEVSEGR